MRLGGAGGAVVEFGGLFFHQRDEFRKRLRWHLGIDGKQKRILYQHRNAGSKSCSGSNDSLALSAALIVNVVGTIRSV